MNLSVTPTTHHPAALRPVRKPHTPLSAIAPSAGRAADIPGRRPVKPITFDSAL
ncbi:MULTISPECIES: hypothetical protein [Streptomyces]|uniref:FXSXX-COOH protein n=2 Tax=Streptomyces TaxID=1883 RepID=A0AB39S4B8_9ACTN|nr:hypothetical protein OG324_15565 [Streptomyces sp. NBC_01236]